MIGTIVLLRRLKTSRAKVKDVSHSSISTLSMLRHSATLRECYIDFEKAECNRLYLIS